MYHLYDMFKRSTEQISVYLTTYNAAMQIEMDPAAE